KPPVLKSAHSQLLLAVIAAGIALAWTPAAQRRRRLDVLALGFGCVLAYLLQLEISTPIWSLVPELPSIQFPWRFQTIMVLTSAMLSGFALSAGWGRAAGAARRGPLETGTILLGLALIGNAALAWQNSGLKPFEYDESMGRQPFVVNWIEPAFTPVQFEPYRSFKQTPIDMPQASFVKGDGDIKVVDWRSSSRSLTAQTALGGAVALRAFWFPGWIATMDGQPLELKPAAHMGVVTFVVPAGAHDISMRFAATPVRKAAGRIGLAGLLLTPLAAWASRRLPGPVTGAPPRNGRAPAVR
ncbi:MAG TPA: hypothetical protein VE258_19895, partial [Ktedonobacterales bacterium]|nr:hypothetical protein [Ktedonobacterales bacterium]